jgi:hypothetical protein
MSERFRVTVPVARADGTTEQVEIGTAVQNGDGFVVSFQPMSLVPEGSRSAPARPRIAAGSGGSGAVFPPYGRSRGQPIAGASMRDLEFYANGCHRTLNDPTKARWHDKERVLLAAIEAEIARQQGGGGGSADRGPIDDGPPPDDDAPPF